MDESPIYSCRLQHGSILKHALLSPPTSDKFKDALLQRSFHNPLYNLSTLFEICPVMHTVTKIDEILIDLAKFKFGRK